MPIIKFQGKVLPAAVKFSFSTSVQNTVVIPPPIGITIQYELSIKDGHLEMVCDADKFSMREFSAVHIAALMQCRSAVDVTAFWYGIGLTVVLEHYTVDTGAQQTIADYFDYLQPLCTSYVGAINPGNPNDIQSFVLTNDHLQMALRDLIEAITTPLNLRRNCARAIDTLRRLIDSGPNVRRAWERLQKVLRVDRAYLQFITDQGTPERHGEYGLLTAVTRKELLCCSWNVMNRYFEFLKRGGVAPLPESEFDILRL